MELTIKVNPTERTVRFREVHALAAGDAYSSVTLSGVAGAQTAALQLKLFKDSSASAVLAQCSSFAEVPGHPSERRGAITLATQALKAWYEEIADDATATDTNGMPSALVNAWLVISDSVKTWAACQVPLILRAMDTNVVQGADGISPTVSLSKSGSVLTISITDVNGTHVETVSDGQDGPPGVSPTVVVDVNPATGNVRVTAVNADGSTTTREVDVSGKMDGASAYPAWSAASYAEGQIVWHAGKAWIALDDAVSDDEPGNGSTWLEYDGTLYAQIKAKQDALTFDNAPTQSSNNPVKSGGVYTALQGKANAIDLPYALVTPGEWKFSELPSGVITVDDPFWDDNAQAWGLSINGNVPIFCIAPEESLSLTWEYGDDAITATRPSLPGHLLDRANNLVDATTGDVTLTLPPYVEGKVRDLLVNCAISDDGTDPYTVTFVGQGDEASGQTNEIEFVTEDGTLPAPTEAGDWWWSLTECAPHKFAVSLKQLQSASSQGGS
jgi:hypothetical protein